MQNKIEEQYHPIVDIWQMLNFNEQHEETYTPSRFVNTFLLHFRRGCHEISAIAECMGLGYRCVTEMFRAETGLTFADFTDYWAAYQIHLVMEQYEEQQNEVKNMLIDMMCDVESNIKRNRFADNRVVQTVINNLNQGIDFVESLSYSELASHIHFLSRSGVGRFVNSKRYAEIVSELKLKKFINSRKPNSKIRRMDFESFLRAMNQSQ